jgi:nucleoside-diphosphate-sugar epimerase
VLTHTYETPNAPERVVVIGAGGFVGSTIISELRKVGIAARGLTRKEADLLSNDGAQRLQAELRPTDAVVFGSAIAPAKTSDQLIANLHMAQTALRAFAAVPPAHLLYISSDAVYADDANPVTERSPLAPSTTHGMMHAVRELMFKTDCKSPFAALRPTLIYGANDPHSGYGPNRFRRQAAVGEPITLFGEGEEQRDHVAVEDVARLAVRILQHKSVGALNAVTGVATSFADIARLVAANFQPATEVRSLPRTQPRPHLLHRFFDTTECHKTFPDFHFERLADGLARVHREAAAAAEATGPMRRSA